MPEGGQQLHITDYPLTHLPFLCKALSNVMQDATDEGDPSVQGPLPDEPEDAPWKTKGDSGIRHFFRKLFGQRLTRSNIGD